MRHEIEHRRSIVSIRRWVNEIRQGCWTLLHEQLSDSPVWLAGCPTLSKKETINHFVRVRLMGRNYDVFNKATSLRGR